MTLEEKEHDLAEESVVPQQEIPEAIRRARAVVGVYLPEDENLSDELIADRRREAVLESYSQPD
jgi:hypothetical protein